MKKKEKREAGRAGLLGCLWALSFGPAEEIEWNFFYVFGPAILGYAGLQINKEKIMKEKE